GRGSTNGSAGPGGGAVLSPGGPERRPGPRRGAAGKPDRSWICSQVGCSGRLAQKLLGACAPCILTSASPRTHIGAGTLEGHRGRCSEAGEETREGPQAGFRDDGERDHAR